MKQTLVVLGGLLLLAGCSSKQLYESTGSWREQHCRALQDADERRRCERSNARSYDDYRAETEGRTPRRPPAP